MKIFYQLHKIEIILIFLIFINYTYCCDDEYYTIRKISNGFIQGRVSVTERNKTGYVFLGIPYAKPPTNELRYKKPQPPDNWYGTREVKNFQKLCLWDSKLTTRRWDPKDMSEDCLYINVYTNKWCMDHGKCPVILYLHGGQYIFGGSNSLREGSLIENFSNDQRRVIFTSINFRIGSLGYSSLNQRLNLSMDTNVGLFDVLEALKWINKEIDIFGGDPGNVGVMGHSAGATAAAYVYTSPRSIGLLHKVIFLGGPITYPYFKNANEDYSRKISILSGCSNNQTNWNSKNDIEIVLHCLRGINGIDLIKYQRQVDDYGYRLYGPVSDTGPNSFMIKPWKELIKERSKIPIIIGGTKYELEDGDVALQISSNKSFIVNIDKLKTFCQTYLYLYTMKDYDKGINMCIKKYQNDINKTRSIGDDALFFTTNYHLSKEISDIGGEVYLYKFNYDKIGKARINFNLPLQVPYHGNDLVYITGEKRNIFSEVDYKIQEIYSRMFVNFLKTNNPSDDVIKFEKFNDDKRNYFVFDFYDTKNFSLIGMKDNYHKNDIDFWIKDIYQNLGKVTPKEDESDWIRLSPTYFGLVTESDVGNFTYPQSYWTCQKVTLS